MGGNKDSSWFEVGELRENGLAGTVQEVVDKIGRYAESGQTRLYLQVLDLQDLDHLRLVAAEMATAAGIPTTICSGLRSGVLAGALAGDLEALAVRSNASVRQIAGANCLESDVIIRGQLLYLPQAGIPPTATPTEVSTPGPGGTVPLP